MIVPCARLFGNFIIRSRRTWRWTPGRPSRMTRSVAHTATATRWFRVSSSLVGQESASRGGEAVAALSEHWAPTFASGPEPSALAAESFLRHCRRCEAFSYLEPIAFEEFVRLIAHAPVSSPGPGSISYRAWASCGQAGPTLPYNVCLDTLGGQKPPSDFDSSLVVFIPKGMSVTQDDAAAPKTLGPLHWAIQLIKWLPRRSTTHGADSSTPSPTRFRCRGRQMLPRS